MSILSSFNGLPWILKIVLLIPGISWITEIVVRASAALNGKAIEQIIILILCIPFGGLIGIVDLIYCILFKKLILT